MLISRFLITHRSPVTRVRYAVTVNGEGILSGSELLHESLASALNTTFLSLCHCSPHRAHRMYLEASQSHVESQQEELAKATKSAWVSANPGNILPFSLK